MRLLTYWLTIFYMVADVLRAELLIIFLIQIIFKSYMQFQWTGF
jgi:hypothetical protein